MMTIHRRAVETIYHWFNFTNYAHTLPSNILNTNYYFSEEKCMFNQSIIKMLQLVIKVIINLLIMKVHGNKHSKTFFHRASDCIVLSLTSEARTPIIDDKLGLTHVDAFLKN